MTSPPSARPARSVRGSDSVGHSRAEAAYDRARRVIAGGVSSDARRSTGTPLFVDHAAGAELWDVDGNRLIDYVLGQGPNLLGHAAPIVAEAVSRQVTRGVAYAAQHELEAAVAERICRMVPCAELVRFNSVGSEAVHGAIRLARGHTGKSKIIKFEGNYHGWLDPVLYSVHPDLALAGDAAHPAAVGGTLGLPSAGAADLIILPYNDLAAVADAFADSDDIAAVIMEPLLCNTGCIAPLPGYLEGIREITSRHGALLIFDEIISGFRVAPGGAQQLYGVTPDLATFGKAMAGGMQVSALAGSRRVMDTISDGTVAHAGTFNSHPVAMAAADATLAQLEEQADVLYPAIDERGRTLMDGLRAAARRHGVPMLVDGPGPVFQTCITDQPAVTDYRTFARCDRAAMARLHELLLTDGINIVPRGLWFLSTEHTTAQIEETLQIADTALAAL
ncbi:aspartate aminotransferase family protein [Microlunatus soli]|uniref:glutamate-1-semialdehyde 2,1-aminomutase n=1 Tax=Microlunatus soli TaxID=630515 RepID=A0A1H1R7V9_9ACTN|nr:glutamate-1-semialdehyde 2,1-aminomutase [Microlunatus soli]SDS31867.1 glutamate-1-semialdehyde 2,1-aminomutase [Microlunatus soli]